jgi:hypothetical protein
MSLMVVESVGNPEQLPSLRSTTCREVSVGWGALDMRAA